VPRYSPRIGALQWFVDAGHPSAKRILLTDVPGGGVCCIVPNYHNSAGLVLTNSDGFKVRRLHATFAFPGDDATLMAQDRLKWT